MRVGQSSLTLFSSKILGSLIGFVAIVYISRTLGASILGSYFIAIAVVGWIRSLTMAGVAKAVAKRVSEEGQDAVRYLSAGVVIQLSLVVLIAGLIILAREPLRRYIGADVAWVLVALVGLHMGFALIGGTLQGQRHLHRLAVILPIRQSVRSIAQIALVFGGGGFVGLLLGEIVGLLVAILIGIAFVEYRLEVPGKRHLISVLDYARYAWLNGIRSKTFGYIDTLVLAFFVTSNFVGFYQVAFNISAVLAVFGESVSQTLFPEMSQAQSIDNDTMVRDFLNDGLAFSGLFLMPGIVGGAILGPEILRIYGAEFTAAATILVILLVSQLFYTYQSQLLSALDAIDRPDISFRIGVLFLVTNVLLNALLVAGIGWTGAAIASVLTALLGVVAGYLALRELVTVVIPMQSIAAQAAAALFMGGIVHITATAGVERWIPGPPAIAILIFVGLGAISYALILFTLSARFRTVVRQNLTRPA